MKRRAAAIAVIFLALSCAGPNRRSEPAAIKNLDLGITLTGLPPGLVLSANQGSSLELRPKDETKEGVLWFAVGPQQEGVNLVAAVEKHREQLEARPQADYKGGQELQGDFGVAFYSRGRYVERGEHLEETAVFMIHPDGNKLLGIHYRYPAGDDSAVRVEQLIDLIGYIKLSQAP